MKLNLQLVVDYICVHENNYDIINRNINIECYFADISFWIDFLFSFAEFSASLSLSVMESSAVFSTFLLSPINRLHEITCI